MAVEAVILLVTLIAIFLWKSTRKPDKFPPGPPRLPLIGSLPYLMASSRPGQSPTFSQGMRKNVKKYGSLVGFWIGREKNVIIGDFELIKELFKKDVTAARPRLGPIFTVRPGCEYLPKQLYDDTVPPGILFTHGKYWQEHRRHLLRVMRDFGVGKSSMEDVIVEEIEKIKTVIESRSGKPMTFALLINVSLVNALWSITTGEKFSLNDPKLLKITTGLNDFIKEAEDFVPIFHKILPEFIVKLPIIRSLKGVNKLKASFDAVADLITNQMEEHKATLDEDNVRDILDHMLLENQSATDPESPFYGQLGYYSILNILLELFTAGAETTAATLNWIVFLMMTHPDCQRKVQAELDAVLGSKPIPTMTDKESLPYLNAVILESHRIASLTHIGVPHRALTDIEIGGYIIPKDTSLITSLANITWNPSTFPAPEQFNPERFLKPDGSYKHDERVIAFGIGKRQCPGQPLANMEIILFVGMLLKAFNFSPVPGVKVPSYHLDDLVSPGLTRFPPDYQVIVEART